MDIYTADIWQKSYASGVDARADIPVYAVHKLLDDARDKWGTAKGFYFMGKSWSWDELAQAADHVARGLQLRGLQKGERVALFLPNCPFYAAFYYGVMKAGGVIVNLNPLYSERDVMHHINDSGARFLVTLDLKIMFDKAVHVLERTKLEDVIVCRFMDVLPFPKNLLFPVVKWKEISSDAHSGDYLAFDDLVANDGHPEVVEIDPLNDLALLQYTGGTTGVPKAAMLTHANITANAEQARMWIPEVQEGQGSMLGVIPFFHVFSMTAVLNLGVRLGLEIVATPKFDVEETIKLIVKKRPVIFPAVPAIYNAIAQKVAKKRKVDLSSIRYCVSGGAPLPVEVKKSFEAITGAVVVEGYGLSEASPVVCVNPTEGVNKPGSIGLPFPGTIVEMVDLETGEVVPVGEKGELCVRGPQVMKGYWNNEEDTAKALKGGRLHTGDVGVMDENGYVEIVDRIKDMVIVNGFKVYPRQVEEVIYTYPGVEECIVAGVPDAQRGEIVKAWVKPKDGFKLDVAGMKVFLRDHLDAIQMPKHIELRDEPLPKTMIGKLSRKDIVAQELAKNA